MVGEFMKLLAEISFPGWKLVSENRRLRMHWAARRRLEKPPCRIERNFSLNVFKQTKRRVVEITRYGPRLLDEDNLAASMKPVLDFIKSKGLAVGHIKDDSPRWCKLVAKQEKGDYGVRVRIYE